MKIQVLAICLMILAETTTAITSDDILKLNDILRQENDCQYSFLFIIDRSNGTGNYCGLIDVSFKEYENQHCRGWFSIIT